MTHRRIPREQAAFKELGAASIRGTQSFSLASRHADQIFTVDVAPPVKQAGLDQPVPVVFVLDGDAVFGIVAQTSFYLQLDPGGLPPVFVVGIGYRTESESRAGQGFGQRTRDLTPSVDQRYLAMLRAAPAPFTLPPNIEPGGAAGFLAFIKDELAPSIAQRYPIDLSDQTIVGMSLGGLFALHVLFSAPSSFKRYIAASPALWWDNRLLFREEAELASTVSDLPAKVFLSVGSLEETADPSARMVGNLDELHALLLQRRYPSLQLSHQVFADETHMSVFPMAVSRGLRAVFETNTAAASWARLPAG